MYVKETTTNLDIFAQCFNPTIGSPIFGKKTWVSYGFFPSTDAHQATAACWRQGYASSRSSGAIRATKKWIQSTVMKP